jgi:hypothetical protein
VKTGNSGFQAGSQLGKAVDDFQSADEVRSEKIIASSIDTITGSEEHMIDDAFGAITQEEPNAITSRNGGTN